MTMTATKCNLWLWGQDSSGYGALKFRGQVERAHRAIWIMYNGDIPDGLLVRHKCDNRLCTNIDHLELGTIQQNIQDREERNRGSKGEDRPNSILKEDQVVHIYTCSIPSKVLAEEYGVSTKTIQMIRSGKRWRSITKPK